jgi:hypothetical protein
MKFATFLLLGVLVFAILRTHRNVQRCESPRERSFVIRTSVALWIAGILLAVALIFLPNRGRVLMLLPGVFVALSVTRALRNSRHRLREERAGRVDLEKMKRVS